MPQSTTSRRDMLKTSFTSVASGLALFSMPGFAFPGEDQSGELVPFLNMPRTGPNRLDWETLDSWITPQDQVFNVQHYGTPEFDVKNYHLEIGGLVKKPARLSLANIKALTKDDQLMTLECSGNGASKGFMNAIYNSKWRGTRLIPILKQCGVDPNATEVVFFGHDHKTETPRPKVTIDVPFGRSMSLEDLEKKNPLLAYGRDGKPLEKRNGAPLRLIVPGWYGIANVKWLKRIELRDRRYMGRFMARDYVTIRGERKGKKIEFVETSVARMNVKSVVARVARGKTANGQVPLKAFGAAWSDGTEIKKVQVKIDDGPWRDARLHDEPRSKFCWVFFSIDLGKVKPGKHTIVSRSIDVAGRVQPSAKDDEIALKKTFWEAYQQWPREIEVEA